MSVEPPEPLLPEATARSEIAPGCVVGVGVGVGVEVGVGVGVEVGVGVGVPTPPAGASAISRVMLELVPPLCVPWMVPVAPTEGKTSCDISEVVEDVLVALHCWVKPAGTFTVVAAVMPTA